LQTVVRVIAAFASQRSSWRLKGSAFSRECFALKQLTQSRRRIGATRLDAYDDLHDARLYSPLDAVSVAFFHFLSNFSSFSSCVIGFLRKVIIVFLLRLEEILPGWWKVGEQLGTLCMPLFGNWCNNSANLRYLLTRLGISWCLMLRGRWSRRRAKFQEGQWYPEEAGAVDKGRERSEKGQEAARVAVYQQPLAALPATWEVLTVMSCNGYIGVHPRWSAASALSCTAVCENTQAQNANASFRRHCKRVYQHWR